MWTDIVNTALVVGVVSTAGAFFGNYLSSKATLRSSANALEGTRRQINLQHASKIAEFTQAWINDLREAMAEYQASAISFERGDQAVTMRSVLRLDAKIKLMMSREDERYGDLTTLMNDLLEAPDVKTRYAVSAKFIAVCQDILKTEWEVLKEKLARAASN